MDKGDHIDFYSISRFEKDPAKRYQSAADIRSELERIEKGLPTAERVVPER